MLVELSAMVPMKVMGVEVSGEVVGWMMPYIFSRRVHVAMTL